MNNSYLNDPDKHKLLYLALRYDLVVGDEFQLFYRGIVKSMNPYKYYIYVSCAKGRPFPRYYTFTPKEEEVGEYPFTVTLYDDFMNIIDQAESTLVVHKIEKPKKTLNVLCIGDSLTCNGVWPAVGAKRFEDGKNEGINEPKNYDLGPCFNFIGTCKRIENYNNGLSKIIGYEGYGGWQWKHFVLDETIDPNSCVWVTVKNHPFNEHDQHSTWICEGKKWVLETIEKDRLKFKRGLGNWGISKYIGKEFIHEDGGIHTDSFEISDFNYERGNPFYIEKTKDISFKDYCIKNNFEGIDLVYILLSWNGMYRPYCHDYLMHEEYIVKIINKIHEDYPLAKVGLISIQSPSIDGGIASTYPGNGYYSDVFGDLCSAYYYDHYLEAFVKRDEYKDFCRYIDLKAQFDVENNYPKMEKQVNVRNPKTEIVGSNGLHPLTIGYQQFGDAFFRALVSDVIDYNKNN